MFIPVTLGGVDVPAAVGGIVDAPRWSDYVDLGGPLMYAVLAAWVIVLAGVLDRVFYAIGRAGRRPGVKVRALIEAGRAEEAEAALDAERDRAHVSVDRIDAVSQLATSIGLFGTVVGLAQGFLGRGASGQRAAGLESLGEGLSTALFTTIAGLVVFLFGQAVLIVYAEGLGHLDRRASRFMHSRRAR